MSGTLNRRQVLGAVPFTAVGLSMLGSQAVAAQDNDQTLRLSSWALPTYIRPGNEGGPLSMMTLNTFMSPFYEDEAGA